MLVILASRKLQIIDYLSVESVDRNVSVFGRSERFI